MNKPSIQILISSPSTNLHFQKNSKLATILSKSTHIYQTHLDAITARNSATKCLKSPVCKKCGESGSDHIELCCNNPIKCANCQGNHPADSRDCLLWKKRKRNEYNKIHKQHIFPRSPQTHPVKKSIPNQIICTCYNTQPRTET